MNEKIKENFESSGLNKEQKEVVVPLEKIEDNISSPKKEELLNKIYKKEEIKKSITENNIDQEKTISQLIKEYFSIGAEKTVKKARKLGAYFLDMLHDELTKKNKSDKGSGY